MKRYGFALLPLVVFAAACAPPAPQQSSEISALSEKWIAAFNAKDIDALVAMYSEDARVLPPNEPMGQGHEAVGASFREMIDAGLGGTLTTVEAIASGDLGYHLGSYTLTDENGQVVDEGKFIELWRRIDGAWKITHDMFSSDRPAAAPAETTWVITHDVVDPARWLAAWEGENSRFGLFANNGALSARLFENPANRKQKALVVDVADPEALKAMLASPEAAAAKTADGVVDKTLRMYEPIQ